ncbi:MAG: hypothetical protein ACPG8W_14195 [Candidatus Promineifilaceae bacterium]
MKRTYRKTFNQRLAAMALMLTLCIGGMTSFSADGAGNFADTQATEVANAGSGLGHGGIGTGSI